MPGRDLTADRLAMQMCARQSNCQHGEAVEVTLTTGQRVAWLCPDCDAQLQPDHWISIAEHDLLPGYRHQHDPDPEENR
jgi:hypothetical protein